MHLGIYAIGKMRVGPERALFEDYLKRARGLGRHLGLSGPDLKEHEAARGLSGAQLAAREGDWLLAEADGAALIVLDEKGQDLSSEDFAGLIGRLRDQGEKNAAFVIGGADGHDQKVIAEARHLVAFGRATWPHMLVRAMLAEQLYRAMTILAGHPYHRS